MNTPYGDYDSYWNLSDKFKLYSTLEGSNVKLPPFLKRVRVGEKVVLAKKDFPVIVKGTKGAGVKNNVLLGWNNHQVNNFLRQWKAKGDEDGEFVIQKYIAGFICDVGGFSINGELFYNVPQKRIVMIPLRGGPAAVNEVFDEPRIIELTKEIVKRGKWTGPFDAEFRWDPEKDEYYLLEFNAKMWGSSPLSLKSNPNLVNIALNTAMGNHVEKSLEYRKGLRYRWITNQEMIAVAKGDFLDLVRYFLRFLKRSFYDVEIRDPLPDIFRFGQNIKSAVLYRDGLPTPLITKKEEKRIISRISTYQSDK